MVKSNKHKCIAVLINVNIKVNKLSVIVLYSNDEALFFQSLLVPEMW